MFRCQGVCAGVNTLGLSWQVSKCGTHQEHISIFTKTYVFVNNSDVAFVCLCMCSSVFKNTLRTILRSCISALVCNIFIVGTMHNILTIVVLYLAGVGCPFIEIPIIVVI